MKQIRILILSLAAVLGMMACEREDPSVDFDNTKVEFPSQGGTKSVSVTTNYSWTATASDPWLSVSPASGDKGNANITVTAQANDRSTSRKGSVTITCRDLTRSITVTQLPSFDQVLVIKHTLGDFVLPSFTGSSMAGQVNWGDGAEETYSSGLKHSYTTAGSHTVEIKTAGAFSFKLESVAGVTELDFGNF
ncbi:MAG: BACON domain-containing protein [Bacteroidales bacterium]|nr:BACON domain-containing protein [Bacteroidales bacterium]